MKKINVSNTIPERMENHVERNWYNLGFNHKTTITMGTLVPMACKEVYPGEPVKVSMELKMRFAALYLPIMHQCFFTVDWFYVRMGSLWENEKNWQEFITQDPMQISTTWAYFNYTRASAVFTNGVMNYLGFNAPPGGGTLIFSTEVGAAPVMAYYSIWANYFRNPQIQSDLGAKLQSGDNSVAVYDSIPNLRVLRRNWPRDYYTSCTLVPNQGGDVLIPSFKTDPESGLYVPQLLFKLDGTDAPNPSSLETLGITSGTTLTADGTNAHVLQLSSTIRDLRYSEQFLAFLERSQRSGGLDGNYNEFVKRETGYDPNPLFIDRPVWIGGYTGNIMIQEVMATAEAGDYTVGEYTGQALARDNTPQFHYTCPDYGFVIPILTVYPKASYYSGLEGMWRRVTKMDYFWEQFALIGDQPILNKEVWFSWYDADIDWNEEIFGYNQQYLQHKYSNDIVSGQMRTLWESFHLGRKFTAASQVTLNEDFIRCDPDIGRVFIVDAEAGEHECYVHAYVDIQVARRLPYNAIPRS